jgi:hypothetical protein
MTDSQPTHARLIRPARRISASSGLAFGTTKGFALRP